MARQLMLRISNARQTSTQRLAKFVYKLQVVLPFRLGELRINILGWDGPRIKPKSPGCYLTGNTNRSRLTRRLNKLWVNGRQGNTDFLVQSTAQKAGHIIC